ncbi:MAG: hypothetical protein KF911_09155 [Pseudomonadales bacterium]|nr:hypothetical protein [Pseudomonadales bacterium]
MNKVMLALGVLGGLIAGGLGVKWLGDIGALTDEQRMMAQAMGQGDQLQSMGVAGLLLVGACVAGIAGGVLAFRGRLMVGGGLMLAGGILPLFFASQAIIFTGVLIAGGVTALAAHFKQAGPTVA